MSVSGLLPPPPAVLCTCVLFCTGQLSFKTPNFMTCAGPLGGGCRCTGTDASLSQKDSHINAQEHGIWSKTQQRANVQVSHTQQVSLHLRWGVWREMVPTSLLSLERQCHLFQIQSKKVEPCLCLSQYISGDPQTVPSVPRLLHSSTGALQ